jgi:hypothetical protein
VDGRFVVPEMSFTYQDPMYLVDLSTGNTQVVETELDGVNQAVFYDDNQLVVGGSINWGGIGLELRHPSEPESVLASWAYEDRRCGSPAILEDMVLDDSGSLLLVSGELYGSRFMAALDAKTLEERSIVHDLDWSVGSPTLISSDIAMTVGDVVRYWDLSSMTVVKESAAAAYPADVTTWNDTLITLDSSSVLHQYECRSGNPLR